MKNLLRICIVVVLLFLLSFTLQAQEHYAKLEKNRNIQAKDLIHELNKTKDTLILRSNKKINSLYSINKDYSRELDFYVNNTSFKLPLNKLSVGKHVMVAVQSPKRIVFVIRILKEIPVVSEVISKPSKVASAVKFNAINAGNN
ncbi:hypothetical protein [Winogradskyella alexanderae]|uniref:Uncharacterized protein n=1 Tax=Winogradskyella alexanderae TaxID=2877123 RepID=A0ABS7XS36_9FLAO|nr:hypothetical protein [Winogradskyella alexanderae]MCA0132844.1 hypothetical protein [Winogradskyella alexanderae]